MKKYRIKKGFNRLKSYGWTKPTKADTYRNYLWSYEDEKKNKTRNKNKRIRTFIRVNKYMKKPKYTANAYLT